MIPIKQNDVTRLVSRNTRVVDLLRMYGRMPVYRRQPARRSAEDKPSSYQDAQNSKRRVAYAERLYGLKPAHLQLWEA